MEEKERMMDEKTREEHERMTNELLAWAPTKPLDMKNCELSGAEMITRFRKKEMEAMAERMTAADRAKAVRMAKTGKTYRDILKVFGIALTTSSRAVRPYLERQAVLLLFPEAVRARRAYMNSRVRVDLFEKIYARWQAGEQQKALIEEYGVSATAYLKWRKAHELHVDNKGRKGVDYEAPGLFGRSPTSRKCLKCGVPFIDTVNHLCPNCREAARHYFTGRDWGV